MVRDIDGGEAMEIRWRPRQRLRCARLCIAITRRRSKPPFDVIEFEKRLRADASNDYADTDHDDRAVTERPTAAA
jgi:hypothetical protein